MPDLGMITTPLVMNCPITQEPWTLSPSEVSWVMPNLIIVCQPPGRGILANNSGDIWKEAPLCLMWCLWGKEYAHF